MDVDRGEKEKSLEAVVSGLERYKNRFYYV
jgi:hypothetical protein